MENDQSIIEFAFIFSLRYESLAKSLYTESGLKPGANLVALGKQTLNFQMLIDSAQF